MSNLATHLKSAVDTAITKTVADEIREIVAREMLRAFHDHEGQFTAIIRTQLTAIIQTAVTQAIEEMLA